MNQLKDEEDSGKLKEQKQGPKDTDKLKAKIAELEKEMEKSKFLKVENAKLQMKIQELLHVEKSQGKPINIIINGAKKIQNFSMKKKASLSASRVTSNRFLSRRAEEENRIDGGRVQGEVRRLMQNGKRMPGLEKPAGQR